MKTFLSIAFFTLLFTSSNSIQGQKLVNDNKSEDSIATQRKLIDSLIVRIDENADELHSDFTPSVHKLSELGIPSMEAVLPLLNSDNKDTRLHAERVLEGVVSRMYGFIPGQGFSNNPDGEAIVRTIFITNGYDWADTVPEIRLKGIENWKKWIVETKDRENRK